MTSNTMTDKPIVSITIEKRVWIGHNKIEIVQKEYCLYTVWAVLLDNVEKIESFDRTDVDNYFKYKLQKMIDNNV